MVGTTGSAEHHVRADLVVHLSHDVKPKWRVVNDAGPLPGAVRLQGLFAHGRLSDGRVLRAPRQTWLL
jgi:hypothetical protein